VTDPAASQAEGCEESEDAWNLPSSPGEEAGRLVALVGHNGDTVETIRELIAVPPEIEKALLGFAKAYPEEAAGVHLLLEFRGKVSEEFERLCKPQPCASADSSTTTAFGNSSAPASKTTSPTAVCSKL